MSSGFEYIEDGFIARFTGDITLADIMKVNIALNAHPQFKHHRYQLFDLSEARLIPGDNPAKSLEDHAIADYGFSIIRRKVRVATVATDPDIVELAAIYETESRNLGTSWLFQTFDNFEKALAWAKQSAD